MILQHLDPSNGRLRARIGRALVATHEYHRAVEFYEAAIREVTKGAPASSRGQGKSQEKDSASRSKSSEAVSLSHDLARLYLKLGRAESSSRVLQKVLHDNHRCDLILTCLQPFLVLFFLTVFFTFLLMPSFVPLLPLFNSSHLPSFIGLCPSFLDFLLWLPSFLPSFLPSLAFFTHSFLPSFLPSLAFFTHSFVPSSLPFFITFLLSLFPSLFSFLGFLPWLPFLS